YPHTLNPLQQSSINPKKKAKFIFNVPKITKIITKIGCYFNNEYRDLIIISIGSKLYSVFIIEKRTLSYFTLFHSLALMYIIGASLVPFSPPLLYISFSEISQTIQFHTISYYLVITNFRKFKTINFLNSLQPFYFII